MLVSAVFVTKICDAVTVWPRGGRIEPDFNAVNHGRVLQAEMYRMPAYPGDASASLTRNGSLRMRAGTLPNRAESAEQPRQADQGKSQNLIEGNHDHKHGCDRFGR